VGVGGLTAGRGDRAVRGGGAAEVIAELREILAEATGRAELAGLGEQVPLFGAGVGLDSLTGTLLLREVHRRFGVDVAGEDLNLDALATLGALAAFIAERTG
jgi:acyl carrier protein